MSRFLIKVLLQLAYGPCDHPAMQQRSDGGWYCTECGAKVA